MSWFDGFLNGEKKGRERAPVMVEVDKDGQHRITQECFKGTWDEAQNDEVLRGLTEGLAKILNYAMNVEKPSGGRRGVRIVGERMVFEMKSIVVGVKEEDGGEVTREAPQGDYEIEVRRVR